MPPAEGTASYRVLQRLGPDPVTEADVIAELIHRTTALRRRLLVVTIAASFAGGGAAVVLYTSTAIRIYGRVSGAFFAAGAILTFACLRRVSDLVARAWEARWIAELARRHELDPSALTEALGMFGPSTPPSTPPSPRPRRPNRRHRH